MQGVGGAGPLILVALDGSDTSLRAGSYIAGLVRGHGARLVCLFVHPERAVSSAASAELVVAERAANEELAQSLRTEIEVRSVDLGLEARFVERSGNPFAQIVRMADELRVDAIVVGASTRHGFRALGALGSRLVRVGRWPVIVVP